MAVPAPAVQTIRLHKGQRAILSSTKRRVYAICGSGGGKTVVTPLWLWNEIARNWHDPEPERSQQYLIASPNFPLLTRTLLPTMKPYLDRLGTFRAMERRWLLNNGGSVWIGSMSDPTSVEGVHLRAAVLDEGGMLPPLAHDTITRRLALHKGRGLFTTTPYGAQGWVRTVRDQWLQGSPDMEYIQFPSYWNPSYDIDGLRDLFKTLPAWQWKQFILGELTAPEGLVYDCWKPAYIVEPREIPADWPRFAGLDHGVRNPTAITFIAVSPDDEWFIYRIYRETGKLTDDYVEAIKSEKVQSVWCDPAAKQLIYDLRSKGVPAYPAPGHEVKAGIREVYERMAGGGLLLQRSSTTQAFLVDVESYRYRTGSEDPDKATYDAHVLDSVRYLAMGMRERRRPKARWV